MLNALMQDIQVRAQAADADLGERMRAALQAALDSGHKKVIMFPVCLSLRGLRNPNRPNRFGTDQNVPRFGTAQRGQPGPRP